MFVIDLQWFIQKDEPVFLTVSYPCHQTGILKLFPRWSYDFIIHIF